MIGLGSIIDRVTGLFGKTYLLAGFFPVLFLAAVSVLAGYDTSEWIYRNAEAFRAIDAGRQALASGAALVVVAMLGFIYWSANPWWRALLQGGALAGKPRDWMAGDQQRQLAELEGELGECEDSLFGFRMLHPEVEPEPPAEPKPAPTPPPSPNVVQRFIADVFGAPQPQSQPAAAAAPPLPATSAPKTLTQRLRAARQAGAVVDPPRPAAAPASLKVRFDALRQRVRGLKKVQPNEFNAFCTDLEQALASGTVAKNTELDRMHVEFVDLASLARAQAENAHSRALTARRHRFPVDLATVGPTQMANVAELYRDHALARYGLDPEVFWLHLQHSAAADEHFRPILEEAKLKLDVSVAMAVACGLAAVWVLPVALAGHSLAILLLTGVALPLAAFLFYRATIANLRVYGDAVRATVDLFRFELLKALHIPLPADSDAERQLWNTLTVTSQLLGEGSLAYEHPKA